MPGAQKAEGGAEPVPESAEAARLGTVYVRHVLL